MKRKRHSPDQIIAKLREADVMLNAGAGIAHVVQQLGVSEQTVHRWRQQYGGMKALEAKRLKELEQDNARLCGPRVPGRAWRVRGCAWRGNCWGGASQPGRFGSRGDVQLASVEVAAEAGGVDLAGELAEGDGDSGRAGRVILFDPDDAAEHNDRAAWASLEPRGEMQTQGDFGADGERLVEFDLRSAFGEVVGVSVERGCR